MTPSVTQLLQLTDNADDAHQNSQKWYSKGYGKGVSGGVAPNSKA